MCGIAGFHVKDKYIGEFEPNFLDRLTDHLMIGIEHRGRDATGIVSVDAGGENIIHDKEPLPASKFLHLHTLVPDTARTVLIHTRFATQGHQRDNENNHPVLVDSCYATHNGHISNDTDIFQELELEREAEVDSIAIPTCFNHHGFDSIDNAKAALEKLAGSYAIAAIDPVRAPDKLVLAKGPSSPLVVLNHPKILIWASVRGAIDFAWGSLIGTPPSRKATFPIYDASPVKLQPFGYYDFMYGDLWFLEGNRIERTTFRPAHKSYRGTYHYSWEGDDWEDIDEYGFSRRTVHRPSTSGRTYLNKWTCKPTATTCDHKCEVGCNTTKCQCISLDYWDQLEANRQSGASYSVTPSGIVERWSNDAWGDTIGNQQDADDPSKIDCWICLDPFSLDDMKAVEAGEDRETVLICEDCATWKQEEKKGPIEQAKVLDKIKSSEERENLIMRDLAWEVQSTPTFCNWLLFEVTEEEVEDMQLGDLRSALEDEYLNAHYVYDTIQVDNEDSSGLICERLGCKTGVRYACKHPLDVKAGITSPWMVCSTCRRSRDLWEALEQRGVSKVGELRQEFH